MCIYFLSISLKFDCLINNNLEKLIIQHILKFYLILLINLNRI